MQGFREFMMATTEHAVDVRPSAFAIGARDVWRVRTLTGRQTLEIGDTSPVGFSNTHDASEGGNESGA